MQLSQLGSRLAAWQKFVHSVPQPVPASGSSALQAQLRSACQASNALAEPQGAWVPPRLSASTQLIGQGEVPVPVEVPGGGGPGPGLGPAPTPPLPPVEQALV